MGGCCSCVCNAITEVWKTLRVLMWLMQFVLMYLWMRLFRSKTTDAALSRIAELVDWKHPVEEQFKYNPNNFNRMIPPQCYYERERRFDPVPIFYPETVEELRRIVLDAPSFRAIGSGHSFRLNCETGGCLISTERMNKVVSIQGKTVTVQAGLKIRDAIEILAANGLALRNMGNYDRQSIGGAIVGGTHGTSGAGKTDTFTSCIVQLKMINALGEDILLRPEESVNYGIGGVVYEVTLNLVDLYYLEQKTTVLHDPLNQVDLRRWWHPGSADFTMIRWLYPGLPNSVCQLVEFRKVFDVARYVADRNTAFCDRFVRTFNMTAAPFVPDWLASLMPCVTKDSCFVDAYNLQYVDDPAPHHTEWEYAVPYTENLQAIFAGIPDAVKDIPYTVEVHVRISPKDAAIAHNCHRGDCVWFDLNVVSPKHLSESDLTAVALKFEALMVPHKGVAHPHKKAVNLAAGGVGLTDPQLDFLRRFRDRHDPARKMNNATIANIMQETPPPPVSLDPRSPLLP